MKHFEIFKGDNNLYGIREIQSLELMIDCQYKMIKEVKKYTDLTMLNFSECFLLFKENFIESYFCNISPEGIVSISNNQYRELKHFYKELTYCILEDEWVIIDTNENILVRSSDFNSDDQEEESPDYYMIYNACESFHNKLVQIQVEEELCCELMRFYDLTNSFDSNYSTNNGYSLEEDSLCWNFINLPLEEKLGLEPGFTFSSEKFEKLYDYDPFTGNFLVEIGKDSLAFINKYLYQVGDSFEYLFSPEDYKIILPNDEINNRVDFIGKDGKIFLIEYTGDFVLESIFSPELFCGFELVKEQIQQIRKLPRINPKEFLKRIYWKFDQAIFDKMLARELKLNPKFQFTDEWIDKILEKEILKNDAFQDYLPFQCVSTNKIECENNIEELNKLLGITYSSYQIIGEIGRYEVINEEYIPNIDVDKLNKILVTRTMSTHQKKRTPFQPGPGRNPRPKSGFFWPKGFNSDDKI